MSTPVMMVGTRRGNPLNLTPDIFDNLHPKAQALQIGVFQLYETAQIIPCMHYTPSQLMIQLLAVWTK